MLKLADVKPTDTVFDLGSGDGRIVIAAAKTYGEKAIGLELDQELGASVAREDHRGRTGSALSKSSSAIYLCAS